MALKKLARVVAVRKWLVVGAALLGGIAGFLVTTNLNQQREPQFEAQAYVEFEASESERERADLVEDIAAAEEAAISANEDLISQRLGTVSSNPQAGRLVFTTRAQDEAVAVERAEAMLTAYLDLTSQDTAEDRQERLDEIVQEASDVLAQLEELNSPSVVETEPDPEPDLDPVVAARLEVLNALIASLTTQHTKLEVDLILAEAGNERAGSPEEIQAELTAISERLDEIYAEIAEISAENDITAADVTPRQESGDPAQTDEGESRDSTTPTGAQSPEEVENQWTIDALESRYEELAAEYESLFVRDEATGPVQPSRGIDVTDLTPPQASVGLFTGLGLLAGAIAALALAFGEAAMNGRIYVLADASPVNGLAEIQSARSLMARRPNWWTTSMSSRRLEGVHRLRIALLGLKGAHSAAPVVGLTGVAVDHEETQKLATDLGRRLIASGSSVLVLDFDFDDEYPDTGYASSATVANLISRAQGDPEDAPAPAAPRSATVADLLAAAQVDPGGATTLMKDTFSEVTSIESFRCVQPGFLKADPADIVFTDAFNLLLEVAREQSDIVLIVSREANDHATVSLQQRLDGIVAVSAVGRTRRASLLTLAESGKEKGAPVGVVLVTRWVPEHSLLSRVRRAIKRPFRWIGARLPWIDSSSGRSHSRFDA